MDILERALIAAGSVLLTGGGIYAAFARQVLTRSEHRDMCKENTAPIKEDIDEIKASQLRLEDKGDKSSKDLQKELRNILLELADLNRKGKPNG